MSEACAAGVKIDLEMITEEYILFKTYRPPSGNLGICDLTPVGG